MSSAGLEPCPHLAQVLLTKFQAQLVKQYGMACVVAAAGHAAGAERKDEAVPRSELDRWRAAVCACHTCGRAVAGQYMCLQCEYVGCGDGRGSHFHSHALLRGHVFAISVQLGVLKCVKCGDLTGSDELAAVHARVWKQWVGEAPAAVALRDVPGTSVPSYKATTGLRGFVNMGATCFISSILQTLLHNPYMKRWFLRGDVVPPSAAPSLVDAITEVFADIYSSSEVVGYGPTGLLTAAWRTNRQLAGYSEQDAHEFWQFVCDQLHTQGPAPPGLCCIAHYLFGGTLLSTTVCGVCSAETSTVDPTLDLLLEINGSKRLEECLDRFTAGEALEVTYGCGDCGATRRPITKRLRIQALPRVLAIQLKRFEHRQALATKLDQHVEFPFYVNMALWSDGEGDAWYELFAVVVHIGSVSTGHYVAAVKNGSGEWFKMDDSVVSGVSEAEVAAMGAYLLYYVARGESL